MDAIATGKDIYLVHSEFDGKQSRLIFSESNDEGKSFKPCDIHEVPLPGEIKRLSLDLYRGDPVVFAIIQNGKIMEVTARRWRRH